MRKDENLKIISLSLGGKYLGVAVLRDLELLHWGIKKLKRKGLSRDRTLRRLESILKELLSIHRPDLLVIKELLPHQLKASPFLRSAFKRVKRLAEREVGKLLIIPSIEAKKLLCRDGKPTKMNMAKAIVARYYPWLYRRYQKDLKKEIEGQWWKKKYHTPLFEAIGLGIYCYEKFKSSRRYPSPSREGEPIS